MQGNGADGIRVIGDASGTTLRNNITGDRLAPFSLRNAGNGIALECDHAILEGNETHCNLRSGVLVRGIGNELKGLRSSGNGECGVHCEGRQTLIGGSLFADRGQIYSNPTGILLTSPPVPVSYIPGSNRVHGNLIGAQAPFGPEAPVPHPNLRGIHILDSSGNRVGGSPRSVEANSIVHNHLEGILVSGGGNNRLHGNFIADNGRLDIDLSTGPEGDGRDPPDPDDLDEGGNHKINPPVLQRVVQDGDAASLAVGLGPLPGREEDEEQEVKEAHAQPVAEQVRRVREPLPGACPVSHALRGRGGLVPLRFRRNRQELVGREGREGVAPRLLRGGSGTRSRQVSTRPVSSEPH